MNSILQHIIINTQNYCHCVEVSDVYELESIAESIIDEFYDTHTETEIIDFLESLTVYSLDDSNEEDIYTFSFRDYIKDIL